MQGKPKSVWEPRLNWTSDLTDIGISRFVIGHTAMEEVERDVI